MIVKFLKATGLYRIQERFTSLIHEVLNNPEMVYQSFWIAWRCRDRLQTDGSHPVILKARHLVNGEYYARAHAEIRKYTRNVNGKHAPHQANMTSVLKE